MRRKFLVLSLSFALYVLRFTLSYAQPLSVAEIFKDVRKFDGKTVVFEGEVIGDVMGRGDFAWVNVYNFDDAIGVWMSASLADDIKHTGSYKSRGDRLEVVGIFHRACREHGGDADIHAQALRKIAPGHIIVERPSAKKINFAVFLLGALALLWIFRRSRQK